MAREKRSGLTISLDKDERARLKRLTELEGRKYKQQIMHMTDLRLAEIEKERG